MRSAEHKILHGLRKMQRNKRLLGELGPEFLEKSKDLERLLKQSKSRNADSGSESSSVQDEVKSESERTTTTTSTTTAPTSPSKMQNLKKTMGATLKTPLSPKGTSGGGGGVGRKRHSSADSDDSQSVSHSETVSDHSDVEIRINVLQDELRRRMMTAAKLKKQQKAKSKEKLRMKEETLKRQIEKYDKLIQETVAELEEEQVVVQPQIKTPYKATSTSASTSTPAAVSKSFEAAGGEGARAKTSPDLCEAGDGGGGEDSGSGPAASHETSVAADTIISKEDKIAEEDPLKIGLREATAAAAAAATISPTKLTSDRTHEDDDAGQSDLNYSDDFTSSNGSGAEAPEPPMKKVASAAKPLPSTTAPTPTQTPTRMSSERGPEVLEDVTEGKKAEERKLAQADRIAAEILDQLLAETITFCVAVPKPKPDRAQSRVAKTSLSPRSRPQDLMLTTFDISSESSDEDRKLSPKRCQRVDVDLENEESVADFEGNYIDDDVYDLSIKKESEELRQQELLIEEEIKRIHQETVSGRPIPDKPPPPYTPPGSPAVERSPRAPAVPKSIEKYVPSSRGEIIDLLSPMARELYAAKFGAQATTAVGETSGEAAVRVRVHPSKRVFVSFLSDLASEIFGAIYSCESEGQNPPWMPQKPLARERLSLPRTESELVARLQREALIFFGMEKRAEKESLIVRWSQKRRDKVDQILVRELHAEEPAWTDYSKDEALVKDQLGEAVLSLLIEDTVKEIKRVRKSA